MRNKQDQSIATTTIVQGILAAWCFDDEDAVVWRDIENIRGLLLGLQIKEDHAGEIDEYLFAMSEEGYLHCALTASGHHVFSPTAFGFQSNRDYTKIMLECSAQGALESKSYSRN